MDSSELLSEQLGHCVLMQAVRDGAFDDIDEERIELFFETYKGNLFSPETRGFGQGIPCTTVTNTMAK